MIVYSFRPYDYAYDGPVELPDGPTIPPYHTFQAPPEKAGYWPFMGGGWYLVEGGKPPLPPPDYSQQNQQAAQALLQATDWTATVDIADPQYSNPYLGNQDAFLTFRSTVRQTAVNPPSDHVVEFPQMPSEQWVNV